MDIPLPPTDSLYKFVAISGLLVMLASAYFLERLGRQFETKVLQLEISVATLAIDQDVQTSRDKKLKDRAAALKDELSNLEKTFADLKSKAAAGPLSQSDLASLDGLKEITQRLRSEFDQLRSTDLANTNITAFQKELAKDSAEVKALGSQLAWAKGIVLLLAVWFAVGMYYCIWGFRMWYFRIQIFQDRVLQAETRKALNGPSTPNPEE